MRFSRTRKPKASGDDFVDGVKSKISDGMKAAVAALVLAALAIIFTPIREALLDLFPDKGKILRIDGPDEVIVGQKFDVDPYLSPGGKLRHAVLKIASSTNVDQEPHQSVYTIGSIPEEMFFSKLHGRPLKFLAREVGEARITCDLMSGDRVIGTSAPRIIPIVRHHEYDGDWDVRLGDTPGTVHLETMPSDDASVYGVYKLDTHISGLISGKFDGAKFSGVLTIGNSASRFEIVGDSRDQQGHITVSGQAVLAGAANGQWISDPAKPPLPLVLTKSL